MTRWAPCKRLDFIRRLRKLGFDGPFSGTRHQFMIYEQYRLAISPEPTTQCLSFEPCCGRLKT